MGVLTETMLRLQGEIGGLRHARAVSQHDLSRQAEERRTQVSALRAVFVRDRAGAHRAWFGPTLSERRAAERQRQQLAKDSKAKTRREREQQRLAEEAKAKAQREQQSPATAESQPQGHNPIKPVPAPAARPPVAPLARAKRPPLKRSKKQ
jgi:hypothetical protein